MENLVQMSKANHRVLKLNPYLKCLNLALNQSKDNLPADYIKLRQNWLAAQKFMKTKARSIQSPISLEL